MEDVKTVDPCSREGLPVIKSHSSQQQQHGGKCSCGLPNAKFCMLNLVEAIETAKRTRKKQHAWVPLNICSAYHASTTPSGPFSSQDLIGSYSTSGDPLRLTGSEEGRHHGSVTDREVARWKNQRPPSQKEKQQNNIANKGSFDKDSGVDRSKLERASPMLNNSKVLNNVNMLNNSISGGSALGAANASYNNQFKALGMRNNFLSGQHMTMSSSQQQQQLNRYQPQPQPSTRPTDELIAMGTNWNPPPGGNSTTSNSGSGLRSTMKTNGGTSASNLAPVRKNPIGRSGMMPGRNGNRADDCHYSDPLPGAPASFQQRIAEIASLEQETIRWEKARKFKKKNKDT